jgi:hypothetical protein
MRALLRPFSIFLVFYLRDLVHFASPRWKGYNLEFIMVWNFFSFFSFILVKSWSPFIFLNQIYLDNIYNFLADKNIAHIKVCTWPEQSYIN